MKGKYFLYYRFFYDNKKTFCATSLRNVSEMKEFRVYSVNSKKQDINRRLKPSTSHSEKISYEKKKLKFRNKKKTCVKYEKNRFSMNINN